MSDAEGVAGDRHAGPRALALVARSRRRAERRRLERPPDVTRGHVAEERRQRVVELRLVACVLVEREAPVLARRQDRPGGRRVVDVRARPRAVRGRPPTLRRASRASAARRRSTCGMVPALATQYSPSPWTPLLAFAAALIALRLSGDLVRRYRARTASRARRVGGRSRRVRAGSRRARLGRGGRLERRRVPRLLPRRRAPHGRAPRRRLAAPRRPALGRAASRSSTSGLAIGVALAVPLQTRLSGTEIPEAQDVLDLWPARILAIVGNSLGHARGRRRRARDVPLAPASATR